VQRVLEIVDRQRVRFCVAVVLAACVCLLMLARSVGWMSSREPAVRVPPTTMEMRLVELPPPAAIAPAAAAAKAVAVVPLQPQPQPQPQHQAVKHAVSETHPVITHAIPAPVQPTHEAAHAPIEPPAHDEPAATTQATTQAAVPALAQAASNAIAASSANTSSATSSGSSQARLLSQPMPVLPDDLREQGYQLTALARFKVHADGTFDVELIKPTQNPRLNQILLDTLHRWRFFPAMENGHPVESNQDVRVHFSVS
jgi:periplasmic protein TonB